MAGQSMLLRDIAAMVWGVKLSTDDGKGMCGFPVIDRYSMGFNDMKPIAALI
jgi:hypothetical protein